MIHAQSKGKPRSPKIPTDRPILEINDLWVSFHDQKETVRAVNGVFLKLYRGEMLGIVGESGCGKSVTAMSILRLMPEPPARIECGSILYEDSNLLKLSNREMQTIRGNKISMVFQEAMTSLNPVLTIGRQMTEGLIVHQRLTKKQAYNKAIEMLDRVQIPDSKRLIKQYPHELSGGMCQRVMIATALSSNPPILIVDEPTTAVDVTIQAQILNLLQKLRKDLHTSIVMITHDLGVIAEVAERVIVMYAGRVMEEADVNDLFAYPMHPYTRGLMGAIPRFDRVQQTDEGRSRLTEIKGIVPKLNKEIVGCAFAPRCTLATRRCHIEAPPLLQSDHNHLVACWQV